MGGNRYLGGRDNRIRTVHDPVVGQYATLTARGIGAGTHRGTTLKKTSGRVKMGAVLLAAGLVGLGLLVYLFYVLFKGEDL